MSKSFFFTFVIGLACLPAFVGCKTDNSMTASAEKSKPTFVLVHGAWGGGWDWKHVDDLLTADGYQVYRATLTGQGERYHLDNTNIDLDTHIADVENIILWENLHHVVLVGHSYGGMVITGVADRVPGRLGHLVYLDALLPTNGESVQSILSSKYRLTERNGFVIPTWVQGKPPPPHDVPQSVKTFTEPITLTNQAAALKIPSTYILTVEKNKTPEQDEFYRFYERAKARGWPAWIMEGDHNVQRSHPKELVRLLEKAARQN